MELELAGKVALVSGGSRGIGLAIAQRLALEGCRVAISARHRADLEAAQASITGISSIHSADVTDVASCAQLIAEVEHTWGQLDVLVTCAGSGASVSPGQETLAEWQRVLSVNLFSATNMITAATPLLRDTSPSCIVCISSICGHEVLGAPITYSAAKSALNLTIKGLARPLAKLGIRINGVSPGNINFPGGTWDRKMQENPEAVQLMLNTEVPMACLGTPEAIADAVAFLASPRSFFTTGANLIIDGGQTRS